MSDSYSFADSPNLALPAALAGSQTSASSQGSGGTAVIISETRIIPLTSEGEPDVQDPRQNSSGASGPSARRDDCAPHSVSGGGGSQGPGEVRPTPSPSSTRPTSPSSTRETVAEAAVGAAAGTGRSRVACARTLGQGGGGLRLKT